MRVSNNRRTRGGRTNSGNSRSGANTARAGGNNNRRQNNGNRTYDSNGPDGKIRGTATQVYDKYIALATDASTAGDRVAAENYYQHAEHYFRIIAANNLAKQERQMMDAQDSSMSDDDGSDDSSHEAGDNTQAVEKASRGRKKAAEGEGLSDPADMEQPVVEFPGVEVADTGTSSDATVSSDDEDQKPKRKVSRTRTLRRRTSSRTAREDSVEEVNSTE
ncbi:MAG: DUF4167 domain-containing protein [Alphaproteobacteria bacterium]|nr:MAG: DUF4167 domain-containing protein [Alphaproteobacteria bacterium]